MLPARTDLWDKVLARAALETPQLLVEHEPAASSMFRLLGFSTFLAAYGGRVLTRVGSPLHTNETIKLFAKRSYLTAEGLLPTKQAFVDEVVGDASYLGFVAGHYLYQPGQGSLEDSAPFPVLHNLGFSHIRSLAPSLPTTDPYNFVVLSVAFIAEDESGQVQVVLVDGSTSCVRLRLDLTAVLQPGEQVIFVQYMSIDTTTGSVVAIVGTNRPRVLHITRTDLRSVQKVQAGDLATIMAPVLPTGFLPYQAERVTWVPTQPQTDLGDYLVLYPVKGQAHKLRYNGASPGKTDILTTWDLRQLQPVQNIALVGGRLALFTPDGRMKMVPPAILVPGPGDVGVNVPVPSASAQDAVFVPLLADVAPPMSVVYAPPADLESPSLAVILATGEASEPPFVELDLRSLDAGPIDGKQGWFAPLGAPTVVADADRLAFTGKVLPLTNGARIQHDFAPRYGITMWLRLRIPTASPEPAPGDGLILTFADAEDGAQWIITKSQVVGAISTPTYAREVGAWTYIDLRIAYRGTGRSYVTTYLSPFVQVPMMAQPSPSNLDPMPVLPTHFRLDVQDAAGGPYEIEWLLVASGANDPVVLGAYQNGYPVNVTDLWGYAQESLIP